MGKLTYIHIYINLPSSADEGIRDREAKKARKANLRS